MGPAPSLALDARRSPDTADRAIGPVAAALRQRAPCRREGSRPIGCDRGGEPLDQGDGARLPNAPITPDCHLLPSRAAAARQGTSMRFTATDLPGVVIIDIEPFEDDRGAFARTFDVDEFAAHGLRTDLVQANLSINDVAGTIRGFHYQVEPAPEAKYVRCVRGSLLDVVVDLRPDSPTYLRHVAVKLSERNRRGLYVPEHCGHAFQTLEDGTHATYGVSTRYTPGTERGLRHDDPALGVRWPLPVSRLSAKDASWPLLETGVLVG